MNKVRVASFATAFGFGAAPACGDDGPAKPVGETDTKSALPAQSKQPRPLPSKAHKQKAVDASTHASEEQHPNRGWVGDFPPYRGGSTKEWRDAQKGRSEREYERLEKLTPREQDEEHAERKRRQEEWQKMRPQEKDPRK